MVTSLNDSRRSKLYRAERTLEHELGRGRHPLTTPVPHDEVQALVDRGAVALGLEHAPRVDRGRRGKRSATAWTAFRKIELPVGTDGEWNEWGRQPIVILHELAHCAIHYRLPGHGREFVARLRELLRWYVAEDQGRGVDAEGVLARFDALLRGCGCHWDVTAKERSQIRFQLRHAMSVGIVLEDGSVHTFVRGATGHAFDEDADQVVLQRAGRGNEDAPATVVAVDEIRYAVSGRVSAGQ